MTSAIRNPGLDATWDRVGMTTSTLCVAHCVASPFLAVALPVIAATEGATHRVLALAILSFALLAFVPGYRLHRRRQVLALGMAGVVLIWMPALLPGFPSVESLEAAATIAGGTAMVVAHLLNLHYCRTCRVCARHAR